MQAQIICSDGTSDHRHGESEEFDDHGAVFERFTFQYSRRERFSEIVGGDCLRRYGWSGVGFCWSDGAPPAGGVGF